MAAADFKLAGINDVVATVDELDVLKRLAIRQWEADLRSSGKF